MDLYRQQTCHVSHTTRPRLTTFIRVQRLIKSFRGYPKRIACISHMHDRRTNFQNSRMRFIQFNTKKSFLPTRPNRLHWFRSLRDHKRLSSVSRVLWAIPDSRPFRETHEHKNRGPSGNRRSTTHHVE